MSIKKIKYNVWELKTDKLVIYGTSKRDCLMQLENYINKGK